MRDTQQKAKIFESTKCNAKMTKDYKSLPMQLLDLKAFSKFHKVMTYFKHKQ